MAATHKYLFQSQPAVISGHIISRSLSSHFSANLKIGMSLVLNLIARETGLFQMVAPRFENEFLSIVWTKAVSSQSQCFLASLLPVYASILCNLSRVDSQM